MAPVASLPINCKEADASSKMGTMVTRTNHVFQEIRDKMSEYKIVPAISILTSVINSETKTEMFAHFWALIELFNNKPAKKQFEAITNCSKDIVAFANMFLNFVQPTKEKSRKQKEAPGVLFSHLAAMDSKQEAVFEEYVKQAFGVPCIEFNPKLDITKGFDGVIKQLQEEKAPMSSVFVTIFEKYHDLLRPLLGALVFISCICGCSQIFEFKWLAKIIKEMQKCASGIIAQRTVMGEVSDVIDSTLEALYSFTGNTYIRKKHRHLLNLNKEIQAFHKEVKQLQFEYKNDQFGKLRTLEIQGLLEKYESLTNRFASITNEEKSLFNNKEVMSDIWEVLSDIRETAIALTKCGAGKQVPVRVWLSGPSGMGKTEAMLELTTELARVDKTFVYGRTIQDEFFSNYVGQGICVYDDIGQDPLKKGYAEWFRFSSANAETVIGAAIQAKGTPFTSRYMFASCNYTWIKDPVSVTMASALGRRRDFLVYVHNPAVAEYKLKNKGANPPPEWWPQHPSEFWLLDPIYPWHKGNCFANPDDIAAKGFQHEAVIGQITLEELLMLIIEKEKENAEMYRRKLIAFQGKLPFEIPKPIEYDTNYTDLNNYMIFRDTKKEWAIHKVAHYQEMTSESDPGSSSVHLGGSVDDDTSSVASDELMAAIVYQPPVPCKGIVSHKIVERQQSGAFALPKIQRFTHKGQEISYFTCSSHALFDAFEDSEFAQYLVDKIERHPDWIVSNYVDIEAIASYCEIKGYNIPIISVEPATMYSSIGGKDTDVISDVYSVRYDGIKANSADQVPKILSKAQLPPRAIFWERNHYTLRERDECNCEKCSMQKQAVLPTRIQYATTKRALLILGDPGVGKTACLMASFGTQLVKIEGYEDLQPGKICWLDDITSSNHRMSEAKRIIEAFNADRLDIGGLVMTGNAKTAEWRNYPDTTIMIARRCTVITVTYSLSFRMSNMTSTLRCANAIKDMTTQERSKCLNVKTESPDKKHRKLKEFLDIENFLSTFFQNESEQNVPLIMEDTFECPMPEEFDYLIQVNAAWADISQVDMEFVRKNVHPLKRTVENGQQALEKVGPMEYLAFLPKIGGILAMDVRGNVDQFIRAVNAKKLDSKVPTTVVCGLDFTLGFITVNNRMIAFKVTEFETDLVISPVGVTYEGREYLANFPYDQDYMEALIKLSHHNRFRKEMPNIPSVEQLELSLWEESPFKVIGSLLFNMATLSLSVGSIWAMISSTAKRRKAKKTKVSKSEDSSSSSVTDDEMEKEGRRGQRGGAAAKRNRTDAFKKNGDKDQGNTKHDTDPGDERPQPTRGAIQRNWAHEGKRGIRGGQQQQRKVAQTKVNANNAQGNTKHDTDPGDERVAPQRGDLIDRKWQHESYAADILSKDGAIVCTNRLYYGVMFHGQVYHAHEKPQGNWTVMMQPYNNKWVPIDDSLLPKKVIGSSDRQIEGIDFSQKTLGAAELNALVRSNFIFKDVEFDFSSWLAFSFSRGVPYDAFNNRLEPKYVKQVFKDSSVNMPKPLKVFIQKNNPEYSFEEEFAKEAMADPTFSPEFSFIKGNLCNIHLNGQFVVHGLLVKGDLGITVMHPFKVGDKIQIIPLKQGTEDDRCYDALIERVAADYHDIARFRIVDPKYPQCKNILNHVITTQDFAKTIGAYRKGFPVAFVCPDEQALSTEIKFVGADALTENSQRFGANGTYRAVVKGLMVSGVSKFGDCGAVLMILDKTVNGKICAIHHSGSSTGSMGAYFTREQLTDFLTDKEEFKKEACVATIPIRPNPHIIMHPETKRDKKTGLLVVGKPIKPVFVPGTTREHRTGLLLPELDNFEPSVLNPDDPRNPENRSMYAEALVRYGQGRVPTDEYDGIIDEGIAGIANEISNHLISLNLDLEVFSTTEAINGPGYVNYERSRPIDRTGSIGYPYNVLTTKATKGDCLEQNPNDLKWYFKKDKDSQRVLSDLNGTIEDAKRGTARIHPFTAYVKDEPLKLKKIYDAESMKTRMFFSGEFSHLLAYRKYYGAFLFRTTEIHPLIPPKVGISMNMEEWTSFTFSLLKISDKGFASDFAGFDSSVPLKFLKRIPSIINAVYQRCDPNWKLEDDLVRIILHLAMEGAFVLSGEKVFQLEQAQVSGNPGTATENSLIVWLLYFCIYKILALKNAPHLATYFWFRKLVSLFVYGDDNGCTIAPEIQSWFHFNSFKKYAAEFGFTVTDAAKAGGDIPDIIPIQEMTFLKRSFVEKDGIWLCPIEKASIGKMIHWIKDKPAYRATEKTIGKEHPFKFPISHHTAKIEDSIDMMWMELALHGKEWYHEQRDLLLKQAPGLGLELQPPTWKEAAARLGYYFMDY